jgi:tetratricopeptide (TPR) repeat protein
MVGLLYTLLAGGLALLRREGLSLRLAVETLVLTGITVMATSLWGVACNPVVFLALLYVITMRTRLLVDLGNALARSGRHAAASALYGVALRLWPDQAGHAIVRINQGVLALQQGRLDAAIETLQQVLSESPHSSWGLKQECGCHYNLGVAYQRKGIKSQAQAEFTRVLDAWPTSLYARRATTALQRLRENAPTQEKDQTGAI